jgi:hypothetical protein
MAKVGGFDRIKLDKSAMHTAATKPLATTSR